MENMLKYYYVIATPKNPNKPKMGDNLVLYSSEHEVVKLPAHIFIGYLAHTNIPKFKKESFNPLV